AGVRQILLRRRAPRVNQLRARFKPGVDRIHDGGPARTDCRRRLRHDGFDDGRFRQNHAIHFLHRFEDRVFDFHRIRFGLRYQDCHSTAHLLLLFRPLGPCSILFLAHRTALQIDRVIDPARRAGQPHSGHDYPLVGFSGPLPFFPALPFPAPFPINNSRLSMSSKAPEKSVKASLPKAIIPAFPKRIPYTAIAANPPTKRHSTHRSKLAAFIASPAPPPRLPYSQRSPSAPAWGGRPRG